MVGEVEVIYEYSCNGKCGRTFEEIRNFEDRNNVICCGVKATKLICSNLTIFDDTKYIFTTKPGQFFKKGVDISGRAHFKRLLKEEGFADASVKECMSVKPSKIEPYKARQARKERVKNLKNRLDREGLGNHVQGAIKKFIECSPKKIKT